MSYRAVTVGDASVEPTLRKALAIGAHDAVRVDALPTDPLQVARELAAVVSEGAYELVICGQESIDYNGGIVPSALAEILGWPVVTPCIGFDPAGGRAKASREIWGDWAQLAGLQIKRNGSYLFARSEAEEHLLEAFCAEPRTAVDCFAALFRRPIGEADYGLATGETVAHLHWLEERGRVSRVKDGSGVDRFIRA